jgi:hypothetical protein
VAINPGLTVGGVANLNGGFGTSGLYSFPTSGNVSINPGLTVGGSASFNSGITVAGSSTFWSGITVAGASTFPSITLNGGGASVLNVPGGGIAVAGASSFGTNLTISGTLSAAGQATFSAGGTALYCSSGGIATLGGIVPATNNTSNCGQAGLSWTQVSAYALNNVSDATQKTAVRPVENVLDRVMRLSPIAFRWKTEAETAPMHRGFLAGDVLEVMGRDFAGYVEENGVEALRYNELVAVLWKAVQELAAKVEEK